MGNAFSRVPFFLSSRDRCPSIFRSEASARDAPPDFVVIAVDRGGLLRRDQDRQTVISWRNSVVSIREKSGKPGEEKGAELRATRSKRPRERSVGSRSISMVFRSRSLRMQRLRGGRRDGSGTTSEGGTDI